MKTATDRQNRKHNKMWKFLQSFFFLFWFPFEGFRLEFNCFSKVFDNGFRLQCGESPFRISIAPSETLQGNFAWMEELIPEQSTMNQDFNVV